MDYDELELLHEARAALESPQSQKFSDDELICECMCVSAGDIRAFLRGNEIDLEILSKELKLGSGCSSCIKTFKQWKDKV